MKQITSSAVPFAPPMMAARNCRKARRLGLWAMLLCGLGQLLIDASASNAICSLIAASMSAVTFHAVIRGGLIRALPLPALIVLGFNVSTMSGALIAQTLSLRPLVYNLQVPEITFALCALFQISLLVALFIFLSSSTLRSASRKINRRVFVRMGIMQVPSRGQLWMIGLFGSAAMLFSGMNGYIEDKQYGNVGTKFLAGFEYLAFAPFILPVRNKIFPSLGASSSANLSVWPLLGYFVLIAFIAIIRNSRGAFMLGIANLGVGALLLMLLGQLRVTARLRRGLAVGALIVLLFAPIMADLAIAMVLVRGERTTTSGTELVSLTLSAFSDKQALENYRSREEDKLVGNGKYEENYLENPFVARFVNIKFFDNTLSYVDVRAGAYAEELWAVTFDKILALLPNPVLGGLGISINKQNLEFSIGDVLYLYDSQDAYALGSYRTGSPIGHGMGLMGPLMFIATVPIFILMFMAVQSLTLVRGTFLTISPLILLELMPIVTMSAGDSLLLPISFMLRTLPQNILIYWLVFQATHLLIAQGRRAGDPPTRVTWSLL
jgi:hypothetical protein